MLYPKKRQAQNEMMMIKNASMKFPGCKSPNPIVRMMVVPK